MAVTADGHVLLPIAVVLTIWYCYLLDGSPTYLADDNNNFLQLLVYASATLLATVLTYVTTCIVITFVDERFFRPLPFPSKPTLTGGERSRVFGKKSSCEHQWVTNFRTFGGLHATDRDTKQKRPIANDAAYRCGAIKEALLDTSLLAFPPPKTIVDLRALSEAKAAPTLVALPSCCANNGESNGPKIINLPAAALSLDELKARKIPTIEAITKLLLWQPSLLFGNIRPRMNELTVLSVERLILEPQFADGAVAKLFKLASDPTNHPVCWHCSEGKDRTGAMSALFLLALGVPRGVVIDDFALSNKLLYKRAYKRHFQLRLLWLLTGRWRSFFKYADLFRDFMFVDEHVLERCFASIDATYGGFNEKYWSAQGLTADDIQGLRDAVLK